MSCILHLGLYLFPSLPGFEMAPLKYIKHLESPIELSLGYYMHCEVSPSAGTISYRREFWKNYSVLLRTMRFIELFS